MTLLNVQWCSGVETRASHFSHFLHGETACGPIQLFFYWFFVSTRKTYAPVYKINKDRAGSEAITPTIVSLPTEEILPRLGIQGVNKTERDRRIRWHRGSPSSHRPLKRGISCLSYKNSSTALVGYLSGILSSPITSSTWDTLWQDRRGERGRENPSSVLYCIVFKNLYSALQERRDLVHWSASARLHHKTTVEILPTLQKHFRPNDGWIRDSNGLLETKAMVDGHPPALRLSIQCRFNHVAFKGTFLTTEDEAWSSGHNNSNNNNNNTT